MLIVNRLHAIPGWLKTTLLFLWDMLALALAFAVAYWIRLGVSPNPITSDEVVLMIGNLVFTLGLLVVLGHYRQSLRYFALSGLTALLAGITSSITYLFVMKTLVGAFVPLSVPVMYCTFALTLIGGPRLLIYVASHTLGYRAREKCLIFGAEQAGRALALALHESPKLMPVAFIDDKSRYQGKSVVGLPVYSRDSINKMIARHGVTKILLAVNNTSQARRQELLRSLEPFALELLTVPDINELSTDGKHIADLREVKIEELLGREPVPPITELLNQNITGKHVMVTGAGGSIGSELCRQIARLHPASLTLFELSEFNLYQIEHELSRTCPGVQLYPVLASIQDCDVLRRTMDARKIQTIYHAAAYKHVPMIEHNSAAGIRNNVFGTANVALTAAEFGIEKFVLVSTDKAVRPTNVMGATKRFAELYVQALADLGSDTEFAIVRFGNVLGSSGSVVPVFTQQIKKGGPLTVTHPDIIRYFMTIPEAAQLVIQAGSMGRAGEVYVLDMGEPVKIADLARKMAHLMGLSVSENGPGVGDIELKYTGLRPGEKLYEELLIDDADTTTAHPRIMGANEAKISFGEVVMLLDRLNFALLNNNEAEVRALLLEAPLAYQPVDHSAQSNVKQVDFRAGKMRPAVGQAG
ncbi:polysaccharide biosynthesis protein [Alteromonas sp. ASW11-19]|uniref:Polysaccharide biosynthesis protein n=1 Tax=Alteromonas salexigens TaxID=2982530 RepID=A0ABT2VLE1_9ALTE|nr:nucleoside-diphosphate sugar epimerase/dehydratase [Alteromonas salexigens]MCU7553658.1 polysaccharide biosynthesis protein [Alteromonas salexigens]